MAVAANTAEASGCAEAHSIGGCDSRGIHLGSNACASIVTLLSGLTVNAHTGVTMPSKRNTDGSANFSAIGRSNKNRGRAFEKKCAHALGWTRVPYSGGSGEWGGGDVVDGFYSKKGMWSAECKTQQPTKTKSISIKDKWLRQMRRDTGDRMPVMFIKVTGSQESFALLPEESWVYLKDQGNQYIARHFEGGYEWHSETLNQSFRHETLNLRTLGKGFGFSIPEGNSSDDDDNDSIRGHWLCLEGFALRLIVTDKETKTSQTFYLLDFDVFRRLVIDLNIMKAEPNHGQ